jgi:hypothetical protein
MADEISLQYKITASKNDVSIANYKSSKSQTMQSDLSKMHHTIQSILTSSTEISTGDIDVTEQHFILFANRDAANFVEIECHKDGSNYAVCAVLRPGEPALARWPARSGGYPKPKAKANTQACDVEVLIVEAGDPAL